jgi:NAD(P)-dependent dehydrogenase (short-subunit alcohol dehydrogenase family)
MHDGRVALVTGAGSGIGRAVARALAAEGWALALAGRTESKLQATAEGLGEGIATVVCAGDVSNPADCGRIVAAVQDRFGRLDALINVAGIAELASIAQTTPQVWRRAVDTNLSSVIELTRLSWPLFDKNTEPCVVVNVSSMASIDPFDGFAAYGAAKVGVNLFTLVTAREGEAIGLKAYCVAPGAVETPLLRSLFGTDLLPEDAALSPAEVATVIVDCVTGREEYENGGVIELVKP